MAKIISVAVSLLSFVIAANSGTTTEDLLEKMVALERSMHKLELEHELIIIENFQIKEQNSNILKENLKLEKAFRTSRRLGEYDGALNHMWLLICGMLVMLMQAGFAMVESGCCRINNVQNILMKNLVDVCVGTLCWWALGWMLAYGFDADKANTDVFAGNMQYFGHEFLEADENGNQTPTDLPRDWFFQWAFCSAAATIVSGGVAERVQFPGYLLYTILMTSVIYPIVVAWMWSSNGWLTAGTDKHLNEVGFNDFAGSGIVHMTGGVGALVGAIVVGPRKGRFAGNSETFDPHNLPLIVLGTFILWFGWYGFNCGSTLGLADTRTGQLAAIVAMNTTISASTGGLVVLALRRALFKKYDISGMCNGILAGLVSITAGCGNVESGSALLIGAVGGVIFQAASSLLRHFQIDDPIDAFPVHGAAGAWGVLAACLFDWGQGFNKYNGFNGGLSNSVDANGNTDGLWFSGFGAALVEIMVIIVWVGGLSVLIFVPLRLAGLLRVPDDMQDRGLDAVKHSPTKAYSGSAMSVEIQAAVEAAMFSPSLGDLENDGFEDLEKTTEPAPVAPRKAAALREPTAVDCLFQDWSVCWRFPRAQS